MDALINVTETALSINNCLILETLNFFCTRKHAYKIRILAYNVLCLDINSKVCQFIEKQLGFICLILIKKSIKFNILSKINAKKF